MLVGGAVLTRCGDENHFIYSKYINLLYSSGQNHALEIVQSQVCLMFSDEWSYIKLIQRLDTSRYVGL
jgi:hypothetical protein